ncbi:hypothetical protein K435DRAFT_792029 [Dendrothele bispora CBS 962.96]|uniref:Uncharacterized protein n=1 Tax=Dendrothele bispora (strain CBS 962.96) TaxID=1314807 RepID=A0A4S8MK03_DENBC|nr:hypothetical protein K435DRAFT_792029 [Dendrothele bispora CBS 962.96]
MKRKLQYEDQPPLGVSKKTRRHPLWESAFIAEAENLTLIGRGGYLDSQTTESQYFEGLDMPLEREEESQPHFGSNDDDWYEPSESQLVDEEDIQDSDSDQARPRAYHVKVQNLENPSSEGTDTKFPIPRSPATGSSGSSAVTRLSQVNATSINHQDPLSTAQPVKIRSDFNPSTALVPVAQLGNRSLSWDPDSINGHKLDDLLKEKYHGRNVLYDLISEYLGKDRGEQVGFRWLTRSCSETEENASRQIFFHLCRDAGITEESVHGMNPVRKAHIAVASHVLLAVKQLLLHGGQARDIQELKDIFYDLHLLLDIAASRLLNAGTVFDPTDWDIHSIQVLTFGETKIRAIYAIGSVHLDTLQGLSGDNPYHMFDS